MLVNIDVHILLGVDYVNGDVTIAFTTINVGIENHKTCFMIELLLL
jgi:hypothetical protein